MPFIANPGHLTRRQFDKWRRADSFLPTGRKGRYVQEAAQSSKIWAFDEARKLAQRVERLGLDKVVFETGYGPSGLPHIGTFGEVARTTMVRQAFRLLMPDIASRLICFSDDMDGLRKVPDNIPMESC